MDARHQSSVPASVDIVVLAAYLREFLDASATITVESDAYSGARTPYTVDSKRPLAPEDQDNVMKDSIAWAREQRDKFKDYLESKTWSRRQRDPPVYGTAHQSKVKDRDRLDSRVQMNDSERHYSCGSCGQSQYPQPTLSGTTAEWRTSGGEPSNVPARSETAIQQSPVRTATKPAAPDPQDRTRYAQSQPSRGQPNAPNTQPRNPTNTANSLRSALKKSKANDQRQGAVSSPSVQQHSTISRRTLKLRVRFAQDVSDRSRSSEHRNSQLHRQSARQQLNSDHQRRLTKTVRSLYEQDEDYDSNSTDTWSIDSDSSDSTDTSSDDTDAFDSTDTSSVDSDSADSSDAWSIDSESIEVRHGHKVMTYQTRLTHGRVTATHQTLLEWCARRE